MLRAAASWARVKSTGRHKSHKKRRDAAGEGRRRGEDGEQVEVPEGFNLERDEHNWQGNAQVYLSVPVNPLALLPNYSAHA